MKIFSFDTYRQPHWRIGGRLADVCRCSCESFLPSAEKRVGICITYTTLLPMNDGGEK